MKRLSFYLLTLTSKTRTKNRRNYMKNLLLYFLFIFPSTISADPVYINNPLIGSYICEFALNGSRQELIKQIEPYIQNGRVYFTGLAIPLNTGSLRPGFEFNLDLERDYIENPRIKAIYRGEQKNTVPSEASRGVLTAGYAEHNLIIITHVFFDREEANKWASTVQLSN